MQLSTRAKEALKTALAMTLVFGIAFSLGWMKPYWAALAVALVSLSTAGLSLQKGVMRLLGTILAGFFALSLLAVFPQDRWAFMACVTLYLALCAYMITISPRPYFWNVSGFVALIICASSGANPQHAFQVAVFRLLETGLGVAVYTLVSALIWPLTSAGSLRKTASDLLQTQAGLLDGYFDLMFGREPAEDVSALRQRESRLVGEFAQTLAAAENESYEVNEVRHSWRALVAKSRELMMAREIWRECLPEIRHIDVLNLLPSLPGLRKDLRRRYGRMAGMFGGASPGDHPPSPKMSRNREGLAALNHFDRAAVAVAAGALSRIETVGREQFTLAADIAGFGEPVEKTAKSRTPAVGGRADADSPALVMRLAITMWLAFLIWIYVTPPGGVMFVSIVGSLALGAVMIPQLRFSRLFAPLCAGIALAGLLYVFVMPRLSGFWEFSCLIFGLTFLVYYAFWDPRLAAAKVVAIIPFISLTGIQNSQTYSFIAFITGAFMLLLGLFLLAVTSDIPFSYRPEKACLRLAARFFRQGERLVSQLGSRWEERGRPGRVAAYAAHIRATLRKFGTWSRFIDYPSYPSTPPEKVAALQASLERIGYQLALLMEARKSPQSPILERFLGEDVRAWRETIQELFRRWAADSTHGGGEGRLHERLRDALDRLEDKIESVFGALGDGDLSEDDYDNAYRLLGGYRAVSEALVNHAALAADFDWEGWREARF